MPAKFRQLPIAAARAQLQQALRTVSRSVIPQIFQVRVQFFGGHAFAPELRVVRPFLLRAENLFELPTDQGAMTIEVIQQRGIIRVAHGISDDLLIFGLSG